METLESKARLSVDDEMNHVEVIAFNEERGEEKSWIFANDGVLYGPASGGLKVPAILGIPGQGLYVGTTEPEDVVVIGGENGQYLGNNQSPLNQIATVGDLPSGATGSFVSNDNKKITVTNGIITSIEEIS